MWKAALASEGKISIYEDFVCLFIYLKTGNKQTNSYSSNI